MTIQEVPPIVASFATQVKMTPIAWRFEPGCVVIVFEQGPKMRFDLPAPIAEQRVPVLEPRHVSPAALECVLPVSISKDKTFTARKKHSKPSSNK